MAIFAFLFLLNFVWFRLLSFRRRPRYVRRACLSSVFRRRQKPDWVRREIVRLKVHLPEYGCRKIAYAFNRAFASRGTTVSKTFVSEVMRQYHYEIADLRRRCKDRIPAPMAVNHTWGLDATG